MLSRNNSTKSNLSAAAAATALRRASTQSMSQQDVSLRHQSSSSNLNIDGLQTSPRPGLRRRTSSMSERSFRATAPEDHAALRRREPPPKLMDVTIEKENSVKRNASL